MREATYARMRLPHRTDIETTQAGKKPIHSEEIYLLTVDYRQMLGRWIKTTTSPQQEIDGEKKITASFSDCRHESNASIRGEAVEIFIAKSQNLTLIPFSGDLKLWISKKRGAPLRSEADASIPFLGQSHTVKVFSYDNVRSPVR